LLNVAMWGRALTVMPRITKEDWDGLDIVSRWLIATRSAVLIMTFMSAAFAGLLALKAGRFDGILFGLVTLGLCLAHATNNLVNDLTDYWKGVDEGNSFRTQYGPQTVQDGFLSPKQLILYSIVTGGAALGVGAYLVALQGPVVLMLLGAGAFFVLFYTFPLKHIGLGEPAVLVVWGPLMVGGSYYVITGEWSHYVAVASLVYALGPTAVLFGKHIDKLEVDKAKKIRTLPVLLGEAASRYTVLAMLIAQFLVLIYLVVAGYFTPAVLVTLAAAPSLRRVFKVYREPRPREEPPDLPKGVWPLWFVAVAFWYNRRFGMFFLLGLVGEILVSRS